MEYELRAGEETIAALRFRSAFGSFATGESGSLHGGPCGCWTFKRVGFFRTHVTVRDCGTDKDIATFHNNTWSGGGTLLLSGGRRCAASTNYWATNLEFKNEAGELLLRIKSSSQLEFNGTLEIQPAARAMPELPWLVILGWYLIVMMFNDAAAASASAAALG